MQKADPINAFAQDWLIEDENGVIDKKELYNYYTKYCNINHFSPEGKTKFEEAFRKLGIQTLHEGRIGKSRKYVFKGISFKDACLKNLKNQPLLTRKSLSNRNKPIKDSRFFRSSRQDEKFSCWICHKTIETFSELSNIEGRPMHKNCFRKLEEGRKNE